MPLCVTGAPVPKWMQYRVRRTLHIGSRGLIARCDILIPMVSQHKMQITRPTLMKVSRKRARESKSRYLRKCRKKAKREKRKFDPQMGDLWSMIKLGAVLDRTATSLGIEMPTGLTKQLESIALLLADCMHHTTRIGVAVAIARWVHERLDDSVFNKIKGLVLSIMDFPNMESHSNEVPEWLQCLRDLKDNWLKARNCESFKRISQLLGLLVAVGFCDASKVTFSIKGYELIAPVLVSKTTNAWDILDAIFDIMMYFIEGGYLCFQTGSLKPLMLSDMSIMELDVEFSHVLAWSQLVRDGNLMKFKGKTDQEFETHLNNLADAYKKILPTLKGFDRKVVNDKFQQVLRMQIDYINLKIANGLRHAPFGIEIFGGSSRGKSTIYDQLSDALLISQGMPAGDSYKDAYNASDKFMSTWKTNKQVLLFDDIGNEKEKFVERPPTRAILDVMNNQMYYAPKAEVESKGKCFVEPWLVFATTNTKDLCARNYSNCPYSIQRRLIVFNVRVKPEFQVVKSGVSGALCSSKARAHYTNEDGEYNPAMIEDLWEIDIEEAIEPNDLSARADYAPVKDANGKDLTGISFPEAVRWAIDAFDEHRKNQSAILEGKKKRKGGMIKCPHEGCRHILGHCPHHVPDSGTVISDVSDVSSGLTPLEGLEFSPDGTVMDTQAGFLKKLSKKMYKDTSWLCSESRVIYSVGKLYEDVKTKLAAPLNLGRLVDQENFVGHELYRMGTAYLDSWHWIQSIPTDWVDSSAGRMTLLSLYNEDVKLSVKQKTLGIWGTFLVQSTVACMLFGWFALPFIIYILVIALARQRRLVKEVEDTLLQALKELNVAVSPVVQNVRDKYAAKIVAGSVVIASIYYFIKAYRESQKDEEPEGKMLEQAGLSPSTAEEVKARDSRKNVWASVVSRALPITKVGKTMTSDQLLGQISKNLYGLVVQSPQGIDHNGYCNALFVDTNRVLVPYHFFTQYGDELRCIFRHKSPDAMGGTFKGVLSLKASYRIPETDLVLAYCPTGGSKANLTKLFPEGDVPMTPFKLIFRNYKGETEVGQGVTNPIGGRTYMDFAGGEYVNLTMKTFGGMCGSPLVSDGKGSTILGVHLGGFEGENTGCYGSITHGQIQDGMKHIASCEGTIRPGSDGVFPTEVMGTKFLTHKEVHKKSPMNYMPEKTQFQYHGTCTGMVTSETSVAVLPISEHIMEHCDMPNVYGPPQMKPEWKGWQAALSNMAEPADPYDHDLLAMAIKDYKEDLEEVFSSELWKNTTPLPDEQNINGMDGIRFIDGIKMGTSIGYPLSGPKREYLKDPEAEVRDFTDVVWEDINRCLGCYKQGERAYPVAKACKKDEILSKPKCRVFFGNGISLTFLVRKYYLPLIRVIQMNPLVSECAVGINAHGPEWEELYQHMIRFGDDRLIGGDYGKYDQKMPSQLIFASLRVLIDMAKLCDYTPEDVVVMEAMTADIAYAYIAFNGDLISLTEGSHISGNSLTVIINGICGSLNLRCYFYNKYPYTDFDARHAFRDHVSLITYGDDNIGSTRGELDFTIKGASEFLGKHGQTYTMPDKESELVDYLPKEEFEFLKRDSIYNPELKIHLGALAEKSIFKSLHCYMKRKKSPNTPNMASAINIDGALREFFNHGRETYERRRLQLKKVADEVSIAHMCMNLDQTYDDMLAEWVSNYGDEYKMYGQSYEENLASLVPTLPTRKVVTVKPTCMPTAFSAKDQEA